MMIDFLAPKPDADWTEICRCAQAWLDALPDDWEARVETGELQVPTYVQAYLDELADAQVALLEAAGLLP